MDLEGSGHYLTELLDTNLIRDTEVNHENLNQYSRCLGSDSKAALPPEQSKIHQYISSHIECLNVWNKSSMLVRLERILTVVYVIQNLENHWSSD
jgi:hypothetical protein